ncbi:MAG: alanine racemase [Clostridia bacterium]|nr:alanine racemase [Clostridia bacterium]
MSCPIICEVSIKNLVNNAVKVKTLLSKRTRLYAVVKSDAYGHGLAGVANALYSHVDGFCVSLASEALTLRICGCDKEILLLTPATKSAIESLVLKDITLTVCDKRQIVDIAEVCDKLGRQASVQLKLNTGMNRLGASTESEVNDIVSVASKSGVIITGAYSHLGDVLNSKYLKSQRNEFLRLSSAVKNYSDRAVIHLSASGGILLGEDYHFDAVRSGIMLYGYTPFKTDIINLEPVMKVYAKTLAVRKNLQKTNLLYGSQIYSKEAVTILRMGYADGFFRGGDKLNPPLCMDLCAVDGEHLEDYVLVMDNASETAKKYGTIPYEILTSCSKRAKIVYI